MNIRLLHYDLDGRLLELQAFLKDIHQYICDTEQKLFKPIAPIKLYSQKWEDLYYVQSYGQTFRDSFIITITSLAETFIKSYIKIWVALLDLSQSAFKANQSLLDLLKEWDKQHMKTNIDFSSKEVVDFRGLMATRHSIIHSSGSFEYVSKYTSSIKSLAAKYQSIEIIDEHYIVTNEQFCWDSIKIIRRFFFYIFKLGIRKFPNYKEDKPPEEF